MKALVTGAGSGIGRAITMQLAAQGEDILLVGDLKEPINSTKEELERLYPEQTFICYTIDLAHSDAAQELYNWCMEIGYKVNILVNNAGMFAFCDLMKMDQRRIERLLLLHVVTVTMTCRLFGEQMASRGEGYILNIASYSQWMPFPGLGLYGASKGYVKHFSVTLNHELREHGVRVCSASPAGVATNLYGLTPSLQKLGLRLGALISPESCAKRSLRAMYRNKRSIVPDWWNRLFIPLCLYMPNFMIRWLRAYTMKFQK